MATGTILDPYSISEAVINGNNIRPGDTVYLRGGTYNNIVTSVIQGLPGKPIRFKPYQNEKPVINGAIGVSGDYTEWEGIELTDNTFTDRLSAQQTSSPTDINGIDRAGISPVGNNTKLINCIIRNFRQGITGSDISQNIVIYGCIICHNGWEAPSNTYGHGIYTQNDGPTERLVENNFIFDNFGFNVHGYSGSGGIDSFRIKNNISFNAGSCVEQFYPNYMIGGNTPITSVVYQGNVGYYTPDYLSGGYRIGHGDVAIAGIQVYNNYFVSNPSTGNPSMTFRGSSVSIDRFDGNTLIGDLPSEGVNIANWPNNTYLSSLPVTGTYYVIYQNQYKTSRYHVAIYNWASANNVTINTPLQQGQNVTITNVQDWANDIVAGQIGTNGSLTISMINHTVATPFSWVAPPTTFPKFGAFMIDVV